MKMKRVVIMAGGTGGHVFPGLAVADCLRHHAVEVHWLGTKAGLESRLVPQANLSFHAIDITGLRGKGMKSLLGAPIKITLAVKDAWQKLKNIQPDLVIGMGGFVSGPGAIAARLLGIPLVIHEQNAIAGLTNQWLAFFASCVLEAFPQTFKSRKKVITTGNPVRVEIENLPPPKDRLKNNQFHLLVLGGSLGAQSLNELVPQAMALLSSEERPILWHQAGEKHVDTTKMAYESKGVTANVQPFIHNMAEAYLWADMVLCRAGALTIAELCTAGLGALLIPYPYAVDDHQMANAQFMVKQGAADCLPQSQLTAAKLADIVRQMGQSPIKRLAMAQAAYDLRQVKVAERIVKICAEVVEAT